MRNSLIAFVGKSTCFTILKLYGLKTFDLILKTVLINIYAAQAAGGVPFAQQWE